MKMQERLNYARVNPAGIKAMLDLEMFLHRSGLEPSLLELVKTRTSQINGCAYCLDEHSKNARAAGETEQRLYVLSAWRDTPFFTDRERAALSWTESLTLIAQTHAPDDVYEDVRQHFSERDLVALTLAIVAINGWNRLAIGFRMIPESYQSTAHHEVGQPVEHP